jgi:hypothetical protein
MDAGQAAPIGAAIGGFVTPCGGVGGQLLTNHLDHRNSKSKQVRANLISLQDACVSYIEAVFDDTYELSINKEYPKNSQLKSVHVYKYASRAKDPLLSEMVHRLLAAGENEIDRTENRAQAPTLGRPNSSGLGSIAQQIDDYIADRL